MSNVRAAPRAVIAALSLTLLLLADGLALPPGSAANAASDSPKPLADSTACSNGFVDVTRKVDMSLHGVTLVPKGAISVGYTRRIIPGHNGVRVPAALINRGSGWSRVPVRSPGEEDGLMAVASREDAGTWAVGFTTIGGDIAPLAMSWDGRSWTEDRPRVGGSVALFTDVEIVGAGRPLAVGYRMASDGRRAPLVYRRDQKRWTRVPFPVSDGDSITLMGVASSRPGDYWVVGHGGRKGAVSPRIYEWRDGRWQRFGIPKTKGQAVLTDVASVDRARSWAVGYERRGGSTRPLVLRWNGKKWRRTEVPMVDSTEVLLNSVSIDPAGGVWVVGAAWNDAHESFQSLAAWWDGHTWNVTTGSAGGTELNDAIGSLSAEGWAAGRSNGSARLVRVCTPPESGVFGSSEPVANGDDPGALETDDDAEYLDADDLETEDETREAEEAGRTQPKPGRKATGLKNQIGTLPLPAADKKVYARDVARAAGVFEDTGTYDAVVEDFDGDGVDDLFIGRHGRKGRLLLNRDGVFVDHEALDMTATDRHGCAAADIDGSGLPDLFCAVGGKRGSGLKTNELWLDPGGSDPIEVAPASGLADPAGRGRLAAFLEISKKQAPKLVVANSPTRVDGLPSLTRVYLGNGEGGFTERSRSTVAPRLGARAIQNADYDRDGREDLLLVTGGPQSPESSGTRLYRNTQRGLVDVTAKMGIRKFDEFDAELVDLNNDKKLDLVQISEVKLMISLQQGGRFKKVFERNLTEGRAVASGDVNGDGRNDLYVVRSAHDKNYPDVMLINRGAGKQWTAMTIPQVSAGAADDAYAIDHDGNGLDDFLVLNGHNSRGPTQLIAFYRR